MLLCKIGFIIFPQDSKCFGPLRLLVCRGHYIKKWILPGMSVIVAVKTNFQSLRGKTVTAFPRNICKG